MTPARRSVVKAALAVVAGLVLAAAGSSCSGNPPPGPAPAAPAPAPAAPVKPAPVAAPVEPPPPEKAPTVDFRLPTTEGRTPIPIPLDAELAKARTILLKVVKGDAENPGNPWAMAHGMLALGPKEPLQNGADPVDWLFENYADVVDVGGTPLPEFPANNGAIRVEPHTDLILKALAEGGVSPTRKVKVKGQEFTVGDLYRASLHDAWVKGTATSFQEAGFNDTPWALQGLATWAPSDLRWIAAGGRPMTMDDFTDAVVETLVQETSFLSEAKAAGQTPRKDNRRGIFRYTCGGAHLVQGAAYAVARGFGDPKDRAIVCDQRDLLRWRIDVELGSIDPLIQAGGLDVSLASLLLAQRLKFLGHWLETTEKILALQLCAPTDEDKAAIVRVTGEIERTVAALDALGIWKDLDQIPTDERFRNLPQRGPDGGAVQLFLDLVGDSAHAVRGIDLATGKGTIAY